MRLVEREKVTHIGLVNWKSVEIYSDLNHPCPYEGHIYIKIDNISVSTFLTEQFLPAGRYRMDVDLTDGSKHNLLAKANIFFSIHVSDHRIERFW